MIGIATKPRERKKIAWKRNEIVLNNWIFDTLDKVVSGQRRCRWWKEKCETFSGDCGRLSSAQVWHQWCCHSQALFNDGKQTQDDVGRRRRRSKCLFFSRPIFIHGRFGSTVIQSSNCRCLFFRTHWRRMDTFFHHNSPLQPIAFMMIVTYSGRPFILYLFISRQRLRDRCLQNKCPSFDPRKWFRSFVFVLYSLLPIIYQFHAVITWLIVIVNVSLARLPHACVMCGPALRRPKLAQCTHTVRSTISQPIYRFIACARCDLWKRACGFLLC